MAAIPTRRFHGGNLDISSLENEVSVSEDDSSATGCNFDCSICLEVSRDPVVTVCGHLFCWPCLHQWITIHSEQEVCPVCKACIADKIIPLYGRGKPDLTEPPAKKEQSIHIPNRPSPNQTLLSPRTPRTPRSASTHYQGVVQENYYPRSGYSSSYGPSPRYSSSSVATFGLFPALFGVHMTASPGHTTESSFGNVQSPLPLTMASFRNITSQQHPHNARQEFLLRWSLILLASFATLFFLLF
ncbi:hypothetical protein KP509_09G059900 [Ceratopteris richardii]|uniref:RING-type E3 ubiquitin transferase n=1 Tax=Ceratopteris richardii TaxID=49495 RepID=A0A8T2U0N3_CERRI|nr:hypothetical protein KP509_09G059900 [Ceratopteris richardii]